MTVGHGCHAALVAPRAAVKARQLRVETGLVDKTSRARSHCGWSVRQRLRAALMSGRACSAACVVFFIAQTQAIEPMPQRRETDLNIELVLAALLQFHQGQIRLLGDPALQPFLMFLQTRFAVAANLLRSAMPARAVLVPESLHAFATDAEALTDLASASALRPRLDDTFTQILTQRPHKFVLMRPDLSGNLAMRLSK